VFALRGEINQILQHLSSVNGFVISDSQDEVARLANVADIAAVDFDRIQIVVRQLSPIARCNVHTVQRRKVHLATKPNSLVADVDDRMPVILRPDDYDLWPDPDITDSRRVAGCLKPRDSTLMKKYLVSTRVNRPENDDQECTREIPFAGPPPRLF
jgi:putative SOS response-associated peptidase YedK